MNDKFDFKFRVNKDWFVMVGSNESGKTTLARYLLRGVPKKQLQILNSGGEDDWTQSALKENIHMPSTYDIKWFNKWLLAFIINNNNLFLFIDDADNFNIKKSQPLKSVFINQRRLNIGGGVSVRRLPSVPIEVYDKAKMNFFARQNSDRSVWYISELMGRDNAEMLKNLGMYEFMWYENLTGKSGVIKVPEAFAKQNPSSKSVIKRPSV